MEARIMLGRNSDGLIRLMNPTQIVRRVRNVAHLTELVKVCDSIDAAMETLESIHVVVHVGAGDGVLAAPK